MMHDKPKYTPTKFRQTCNKQSSSSKHFFYPFLASFSRSCFHDFDCWPSKGSYPTVSNWLSLLALQPKSLRITPGMWDLSVNPRWPAYPCPSRSNMTANTKHEGLVFFLHLHGSNSELFTEQELQRCFLKCSADFWPDVLCNFVYKLQSITVCVCGAALRGNKKVRPALVGLWNNKEITFYSLFNRRVLPHSH